MAYRDALTNVKKYIECLKKNRFAVQKVYVFGSYAKGNMREDSDIDLAVVLKNLRDIFTTQVQLMKLRRDFDLRIEPHPFDETDFNSSNPFVHEILTTGIQVF
ncbi:MAG: nucleotidyltransferase domain-containing protein [Candidatus Aminicenantes bacterium]|nr:nucleotidyltransferase domain-containing protein [Candidatus Aminicenantes bacterium]